MHVTASVVPLIAFSSTRRAHSSWREAWLGAGSRGQGKLNFSQWLAFGDMWSQLFAIGQTAVVRGANQPIYRAVQLSRPHHQWPHVRLAVGHIDEARGGQARREFRQTLVTFDSAQALLRTAALTVGVAQFARPHPHVENPQRLACALIPSKRYKSFSKVVFSLVELGREWYGRIYASLTQLRSSVLLILEGGTSRCAGVGSRVGFPTYPGLSVENTPMHHRREGALLWFHTLRIDGGMFFNGWAFILAPRYGGVDFAWDVHNSGQ
jgi:hypothetical protein